MEHPKPVVKIKDAVLVQGVMTGLVYGHPKFKDGTRVRTSLIEKIETLNTVYVLED